MLNTVFRYTLASLALGVCLELAEHHVNDYLYLEARSILPRMLLTVAIAGISAMVQREFKRNFKPKGVPTFGEWLVNKVRPIN